MAFKIVIPSANSANLKACIESIRRYEPSLPQDDIIVVDDGARVGAPPARWVAGIRPFVFARNVNRGILAADSDVLVLNDDARLLTHGGFSALAETAARHRDYGIICPALTKAFLAHQVQRQGGELRDGEKRLAFPAVFIPQETQKKSGLLDERFVGYGFEDDDYCRRVLNAGLKLGIYDGCLVEHLEAPSSFRSYSIREKLAQNRLLYDQKWQEKSRLKSGVTLVVTSCGRSDLLLRTLRSFERFNTYPLAKTIVVEDGPGGPPEIDWPHLEFLSDGCRHGQLYSIDWAYSRVQTEYIFHCEDDWEFFRPGFVEESLAILETWANIFQVWVRDDTTFHMNPGLLTIPVLDPKKNSCPSLTWNPGLRRLADYQRAGGSYAALVGVNHGVLTELRVSQHYKKLGFYAAVIPAAVRHIGDGRHVLGPRLEQVWQRGGRNAARAAMVPAFSNSAALQTVAQRPRIVPTRVRPVQLGGRIRLASEMPSPVGESVELPMADPQEAIVENSGR